MTRYLSSSLLVALILSFTTVAVSAQSLDDFAVEAGVPLLAPMGALADLSSFAGGFCLTLGYDSGLIASPWGSAVEAILGFEYLSHRTAIDGTTLSDVEIVLGAETDYPIGPEPLAIVARAGVGVDIHTATGTWNAQVSGETRYTDMFVQLGTGVRWSFGRFGSAVGLLRYTLFPEEDNSGHLLGAVIGYRYELQENRSIQQ